MIFQYGMYRTDVHDVRYTEIPSRTCCVFSIPAENCVLGIELTEET